MPLFSNPTHTATDDLERTFVAKGTLRDELLKDIRADVRGGTRRHWLVEGARGIGKTHFVELVARTLAREHWLVARFPEEHDQVVFVSGSPEAIAVTWEAPVQIEPTIADDKVRFEDAILEIQRKRERTGQHGLVVVENLDVLLRKLGRQRQLRLREVLMNRPPFTLLGTATSYTREVSDEDQPFYHFFQRVALTELNVDEMSELIERRAELHSTQIPLAQRELLRERAQVIHHFTGGNPRRAMALYAALRDGESEDADVQVQRLLDDVTPEYRARLAELTAQEQSVLATVACVANLPTLAELARVCSLETARMGEVIERLQEQKLIRVTSEDRVELCDRFLRTWLQRERPAEARRVQWLGEFFQSWYEKPRAQQGLLAQIARVATSEDPKARARFLTTMRHILPEMCPVVMKWQALEWLTHAFAWGGATTSRSHRVTLSAAHAPEDTWFERWIDHIADGRLDLAHVWIRSGLEASTAKPWVWSAYRVTAIAANGVSVALGEMLALAQREDADPSFCVEVGIDAIQQGRTKAGNSLVRVATGRMHCGYCRQEVFTSRPRRRLMQVEEIYAPADKALAQLYHWLCLAQELPEPGKATALIFLRVGVTLVRLRLATARGLIRAYTSFRTANSDAGGQSFWCEEIPLFEDANRVLSAAVPSLALAILEPTAREALERLLEAEIASGPQKVLA